jgi:excisionase family DNA binding protein
MNDVNPFTEIKSQLSDIQRKLDSLGATTPQPEFLNVDEAADFLNLSKSAIYKRTMANELPFYKSGRKLSFRREELANFIKQHRFSPEPLRGVTVER